MTQYLEYKGYHGTIEPQIDDGTLFGKVAFIRDLITYEADTLPKLIEEFHQSVDGYLEDCEELGREPDQPFKGSLNVRLGQQLHREMALTVESSSVKSLNAYICAAIREKLERDEDEELCRLVEERKDQPHIRVDINDL